MKSLNAIFFMIAASFAFATGSILTKMLGKSHWVDEVHPIQIAHARFFFAFIFLLILSIYFKPKFRSMHLKLHALRSLFGCVGISIWFIGIMFIPISDATAINFLNPIFAMAFAVIFLKEEVGLIRWSAGIFSFFGGLLLLRPSIDLTVDPIAAFCLLGALIMGLEIICIKALSGREDIFKILLFNNFFASCFATILLPFFFDFPSFNQVIFLMSVAFCFVSGQFFFIESMKRSDASFVMPFLYSTIVFVVIHDFIFFDIYPDIISFAGAFIIILGAIIFSYREWKLNKI